MLLSRTAPAIAARQSRLSFRRWRTTLSSNAAPVPEGLDLDSMVMRRAVLYVPCSEERKIQKSYQTVADCVMYDLEDGVALNRKEQARELLHKALNNYPSKTRELGVRINSRLSGLQSKDLETVMENPRVGVIMVPKVDTPEDLWRVSEAIGRTGRHIGIIAGVETALGLLNIRDIAGCSKYIDALLFAAEDYCADTGIIRTPGRQELYHARSLVATAAHAYKLQAIDMVTMDFRNPKVLAEESREGAVMGFTGKQVIHPDQVDVVQRAFAPQPDDLERAYRIVQGYTESYEKGLGAFDLDGKAIDMPVIKWAYKVVKRAELAVQN
ncbi:hypothetical protein GGI07_001888 [Coemansia sp. Benny D115]|nr:hypothetical protein GGI07_001888 [Coemansia sp. Benny D115]